MTSDVTVSEAVALGLRLHRHGASWVVTRGGEVQAVRPTAPTALRCLRLLAVILTEPPLAVAK